MWFSLRDYLWPLMGFPILYNNNMLWVQNLGIEKNCMYNMLSVSMLNYAWDMKIKWMEIVLDKFTGWTTRNGLWKIQWLFKDLRRCSFFLCLYLSERVHRSFFGRYYLLPKIMSNERQKLFCQNMKRTQVVYFFVSFCGCLDRFLNNCPQRFFEILLKKVGFI